MQGKQEEDDSERGRDWKRGKGKVGVAEDGSRLTLILSYIDNKYSGNIEMIPPWCFYAGARGPGSQFFLNPHFCHPQM